MVGFCKHSRITYWFIDHPGINDEELKAVYHIRYEQVTINRQGVTDVFTNEKIKAICSVDWIIKHFF